MWLVRTLNDFEREQMILATLSRWLQPIANWFASLFFHFILLFFFYFYFSVMNKDTENTHTTTRKNREYRQKRYSTIQNWHSSGEHMLYDGLSPFVNVACLVLCFVQTNIMQIHFATRSIWCWQKRTTNTTFVSRYWVYHMCTIRWCVSMECAVGLVYRQKRPPTKT